MTRPSRNDIRDSAVQFAHDWQSDSRERGEAQTFWTEFLRVFGVDRRRVNAAFEQHARRASTGGHGFIDLLWPGMLLAEHKSLGGDLDSAMGQALDYIDSLTDVQLPRLVVVSDFARFRVLDLEDPERIQFEFPLDDLSRQVDRFLVLAGYTTRRFEDEAAVNVEAAELLGRVYDEIADTGYEGHPLRVFIVRLLFLLFGDDTGLWQRNQFFDLLSNRTAEDGSDLGMWLGRLFQILDDDEPDRTTALDEDLAAFPYVNGGLFREPIDPPDTTRSMRDRLLEACAFDWAQISPAIFGAMFQSVMDPEARRALGAHYTSERNIMRVIRPLFLDELEAELEACATSKVKLRRFHEKLGTLTFFDPACGCGNFLVIAYRELRRLEREALLKLHPQNVQMTTLLGDLRTVNVSQFFGIEIEEFPVRIAETAMYLIDHLENEALSAAFGSNIVDLPLTATASIERGNALHFDWDSLLPAGQCSYLYGNPPFLGKHLMSDEQSKDLEFVFGDKESGSLDYVTGWFRKAASYMADNPDISGAFVATNSVTQGEQVPLLWPKLHALGLHVTFGWRPFRWTSEARGVAKVHVVVIGFRRLASAPPGQLFEVESEEPERSLARSVPMLNGYLMPAHEVYPKARSRPLVPVPPVVYGSKPVDNGHLLLVPFQVETISEIDPIAHKYVRELMSDREFVHGETRYCLWLEDADPRDIRSSTILTRRLESVRNFRLESRKASTRALAATPGLFAEIRRPTEDFIFVPIHVSGARRLVPMGFVKKERQAIVHNSGAFIEGADLTLFGILQSEMFSAWQRVVGGRIKSDYRFNNKLVYNTFPFPKLSDRTDAAIATAAQAVLDARGRHPEASLADLYDPIATPRDLVRAHAVLDRAVDGAFTRAAMRSDADRLPVLFEHYERIVAETELPGLRAPRITRSGHRARVTRRDT